MEMPFLFLFCTVLLLLRYVCAVSVALFFLFVPLVENILVYG